MRSSPSGWLLCINGIQLLTVAFSKIFVPLRSAISNRRYSSAIILRSFLPYFWFVKGYGTIIEKTPLGHSSCIPSSMKGTYKSHFSLSDLYFLLATIRCRCSFNSGDAICVGALMYGGLPMVMSKPPPFEGREKTSWNQVCQRKNWLLADKSMSSKSMRMPCSSSSCFTMSAISFLNCAFLSCSGQA